MKRILFSVALFFVCSSFVQAFEDNESWLTGLSLTRVVDKIIGCSSEKAAEKVALEQEMAQLDEEREHYDALRLHYIKQLQTIIPARENGVTWYFNRVRGEPSPYEQEAYNRWHAQVLDNAEAKKIDTQLRVISQLRLKNLEQKSLCESLLLDGKDPVAEKIAKDLAPQRVVYRFRGYLGSK